MFKSFLASGLFLFLFCLSANAQQDNVFKFGFNSSLGLTQIEGDNLRGFHKVSYNFGLLGGYRFAGDNEYVVSIAYGNLGSSRSNESRPSISGKYLTELNMKRASLFMGYSKSIGIDWDGSFRYRVIGGFQYNRVLSTSASLISSSVNDTYNLQDSDFESNYLSFKFGFGVFVGSNFVLDLQYEHSLQSVLNESEEIRVSKLVPFGLNISISYYLD